MEEFIMNKYHIQIENDNNGYWDWIAVFAENEESALDKAKIKLYEYQSSTKTDYWSDYYREIYSGYEVSHIFSMEKDCVPLPEHDTIIRESNADQKENTMNFFNVNWNDYIKDLITVVAPENWSNKSYPNNGILVNYMAHTYKKLKSDGNIIQTGKYGLFNTGLFTKYYEPIYAYATNEIPVQFKIGYELGELQIAERPERANYFTNPELLLFDWHYNINIQYKHILDDVRNNSRLPKDILSSNNLVTLLNGAIDTMKKRVSSNYKLAIPQYFDGKIQLLLPLCLLSDNKPDLALVITKVNDYYQGHTCITLDMAYNNARLIAKPESDWLSLQ